MSELKIEIQDDRSAFKPGEEIRGRIGWDFPEIPKQVELRLFWFTRGKGTEDVTVHDKLTFQCSSRAETRMFSFRLPAAPYSFSGKLISLTWSLELVATPGKQVCRRELTLAPDRREILLEALPDREKKRRWFALNQR